MEGEFHLEEFKANTETTFRELQGHGLVFDRLPKNIYSEMPIITIGQFLASGKAPYGKAMLYRLIRSGAVPSTSIAGQQFLTPLDVQQILKYSEESSKTIAQRGGLMPGSKIKSKSYNSNPMSGNQL
jgi:hypothetical protein